MSKREWKPGDLAASSYHGNESVGFVVEGRSCPQGHPNEPHWHGRSGGWNKLGDPLVDFRPLVVIDPEDREQVERLGKAIYDNGFTAAGRLADALREFANPTPPKPDEPQGLGAVVEDEDGKLWVRAQNIALADMRWHHTDDNGKTVCAKWIGVSAVRVLSEGVVA